jgi:hypothetical protein
VRETLSTPIENGPHHFGHTHQANIITIDVEHLRKDEVCLPVEAVDANSAQGWDPTPQRRVETSGTGCGDAGGCW